MTAGFDVPSDLPPSHPGGRPYRWLFAVTAFVALLVVLLGQSAALKSAAVEACRSFQLCSPPPSTEMPPFRSAFVEGHGAEWAAQETLAKYRSDNPDYDISFHVAQNEEKPSCGDGLFDVRINCRYSYAGTWTAEPKWRGLLAPLGL